jgi:DNA primase
MGIGWAIATVFSQDIFSKYKCMPILFPHGKRESGKSTFMRWIMACFGVENDGVGIAETTQNYIARSLSYFSSLGCWFDEYRNEQKVIQKDGFFMSAYNRQISGKGTATSFQTKGFSVNAAVAISGEELPKDNGLFTRLIPLQISEYKRDRTWFDWIQRHTEAFSYLTYYLLLNYNELKPKIMDNIAALKEALLAKDISDRTAENWAICAGAFDTVITQDNGFIKWVEQTCQEIKRTGETEHMLNQFLGDISVLVSEGKLTGTHLRIDKDTVAIWLRGVIGVWSSYYRSKTGREPFDEVSIRKYLIDEPYYIDSKLVRFLDGGKQAIIVSISQAPEALQEACEILKNRQWNPVTEDGCSNDNGF